MFVKVQWKINIVTLHSVFYDSDKWKGSQFTGEKYTVALNSNCIVDWNRIK